MRSTQIEGGRWVSYVPGEFTTLMALFSTEPASRQLNSMDELHRLFERANRNLLSQQPVDPDQLVGAAKTPVVADFTTAQRTTAVEKHRSDNRIGRSSLVV